MDWWTPNSNLAWLGSMTTWWILGPLLIVLLSWVALKVSQRPRSHRGRRRPV
jgi:hypothetical protein